MKISKIIDELTELKEYIGDKDLNECMVNDAMTSVNVLYMDDEGGWTSTCLEGEKAKAELKSTMSDHEAFDKIREKKISEDQKNPYADFNIRHVTLTSCVPSAFL